MKYILSILALIAVGGQLGSASNEESVTLDLFYEALCPDSIYFMVLQLFPTWQKFGTQLQINYKPFGFASWVETGDGGFTFECQHGADECLGNKAQACLLNMVPKQEEIVPLINCMMKTRNPPSIGDECISELNLDVDVRALGDCLNSNLGSILLHDYGVETKNADPKINYVPWIVLNGEFSRENLDMAQSDLTGLLCEKYLPNSPACN